MKSSIRQGLLSLLVGTALWTKCAVEAKAVFAHYMVGTVDPNTNHAATDIDQAIAVGFDAFALNVGNPGADWARNTISQLFNYANGKNFGLFFSFDFYGNGDINAHLDLYNKFKDHPAYYRYGPAGQNVVSTFSGGSLGPDVWRNFKQANNVYLLPNVEADGDYYNNPSSFFQRWNGAVDGVFSWETSWPFESETPVNVSSVRDEAVKDAADASQKAYMMGLSPLQYKRCCGASWYRVGEVNLPERMTQILSIKPDFTEVITWNDAGESHYIGPCWAEGLPEEILKYGNSDTHPHFGWQPLVSSFIDAFKNGRDAGQMTPRGGNFAGAMWYRGVLKSCPGEKPPGNGAAVDAVNYAVVLPSTSQEYSIRVSSNGQTLATIPAQGGLNYNSVAGMTNGAQKIEVLDSQGAVIATAASKVDVVQGPVGGFCNFNYQVAGLA